MYLLVSITSQHSSIDQQSLPVWILLRTNLESPSEPASDRIVGDSCTTIRHDWCVDEPSRRVTVNIMKQSQGMMSLTALGHRLVVTRRGRTERVRTDTQHDSCSTNCLQPTSAVRLPRSLSSVYDSYSDPLLRLRVSIIAPCIVSSFIGRLKIFPEIISHLPHHGLQRGHITGSIITRHALVWLAILWQETP